MDIRCSSHTLRMIFLQGSYGIVRDQFLNSTKGKKEEEMWCLMNGNLHT
jgi:hypothetical protein